MTDKVTRREFIEKTTAAAVGATAVGKVAGAAEDLRLKPDAAPATKEMAPEREDAPSEAKGTLPRRTLGRTGAQVSILAFGCGSRFLAYPANQASAVLEEAIASGINYFDTAVDYGNGESETRVGRVMATRRKEVFLATKIPPRARTRDAALKEFEASLKRLQTDHVDLVHLHGLSDEADLAAMEVRDGAIKALYELRDQKAARFVGMTSHTDGAVMAKAIERHDLDCVQMAMNPVRGGRFEELALPAANRKKLGVILMKVTAQEKLLGEGGADVVSLLRYAWSLPIATAVCGMPKLEFLAANVAAARGFTGPMAPADMERLHQRLAGKRFALDQFFATHRDEGWMA
jgi:predicted aldo/keto reductase-like oxidoreductase